MVRRGMVRALALIGCLRAPALSLMAPHRRLPRGGAARRAVGGLGDWDYAARPKAFEAGGQDKLAEALGQLDDETVQKALDCLAPLITENRRERLEEVLQQRCGRVQFLFENPANPSNVWACLRSMDAFGVAKVHVVVDEKAYGVMEAGEEAEEEAEEGAAALTSEREAEKRRTRVRSMKSAAGSAQWLLLEEHGGIAEALERIRAAHPKIRVFASDLSPGAVDVNDIDFGSGSAAAGAIPEEPASGSGSGDAGVTVASDEDVLVIMGNEDRGISAEARSLADHRYYLPMRGFAESFNLSVATAITLAYLQAKGGLVPGSLKKADEDRLRLRWYMQSAARGSAIVVLRRYGIELPGLEGEMHIPRTKIMNFRA
uniref:tRNA/rRNA methyltransferase SpoU type domain-containing protein n=1 Tax=Phaeomonas parva TaxID=124430 RepID=A0A7S1XWK1_9STRA|mmetsp:Transcript_44076/g.138512  ORF Transcript_44076/g.138512 Transcript_44076/m.138512 type:complete len:373 (+) Transcript_44076:100-1218(+)|eukprot:CAMPEP_0118868390 /NCGR_PEP_ID=MMETSP1163-20130328/11864_1 /TAXON_ID=124430 /ORGANISM="Phaeomonas parva, Strain CCMP2877" /LENGTH=372 /DNA_ID=CAMNT_0006803055 /DNA_START=77 /DNA_END=1198 /DNA_ORIENTATION=-